MAHPSGMDSLTAKELRSLVQRALTEDVGAGDATTLAVVPGRAKATALMVARQPLVVAGLAAARTAFQLIQPSLRIAPNAKDGQAVKAGAVLMTIAGSARGILTAERVALNFVQRLSGVATLTAAYVARVKGTRAQILDTRKTTPGLRRLEKYAVSCGGGKNHRLGLFDLVLIKDNHLAAVRDARPNAVAFAVRSARAKYPALKVEVEADTLAQVAQAADAGADYILLDNMTPAQLRRAVRIVGGRALTEASGGVNLRTVGAIARSGVDFISVGALTHSAPAVDVALDFQNPDKSSPTPGIRRPHRQ
jgi:nicotinate-nucleotide pyrophosphorylase (carboxylating)